MRFLPNPVTNRILCGIVFSFIIVLLILLFLFYPTEQNIDSLMLEIYALPTSTTIHSLEQDGYLNLTDIQPKQISDIHAFLQGEDSFRPTILKTVTDGTDGPLIRIFYRPAHSSIVYMTSYDVVRQVVYNLNNTYYNHTFEVYNDNCGTAEVWLEPHGNYEPYMLYSYYCN